MADFDACVLLWRIIGMTLGLLMNFVTSITPYWAINVGEGQVTGQLMNFGIFYACKKDIPWCWMAYKELHLKIPVDSTNRFERLNFPRWLITCQFFAALGLALSIIGLIAGCCQSVTDKLNSLGKRGRFAVAMIFLFIALCNLIVVGIWFTTIKEQLLDIILHRWKGSDEGGADKGGAVYVVGWTCYLSFFTILINIVTGVLFITKTGEDEEFD